MFKVHVTSLLAPCISALQLLLKSLVLLSENETLEPYT